MPGINPSPQTIPLLIGALAGVAFLLAVLWMLDTGARGQARRRAGELLNQGFTSVETPAPELVDAVLRVQRHAPGQRLVLRDVFQKHVMGGQMMVFDLVSPGLLGYRRRLASITSTLLSLPHATLMPRPAPESMRFNPLHVGADQVFRSAVERSGQKILSLEDHPEFHRRYIVITREEEAARAFLTPKRMAALILLSRPYQIDMGEATFTLAPFHIRPSQPAAPRLVDPRPADPVEPEPDYPNLLLDDAKTLFRLFQIDRIQ